MYKRFLSYLIAVFAVFSFTGIQAQSIEFSAKASKTTVAADEAFKLTYTVNTQADFTAPDLKDFKLLSGPASSSYSQIQVYNGQMRNSYTMTWTMVVRPRKEGEFVIPPATVTSGGKSYRSNAIKMSVTKATGNGTTDDPNAGNGQVNKPTGNGKSVFCNISISKNKVYKGEPLLVTYNLYSRYTQIQDYDIKLSTQKDVWAQEITNGKQGWPSYEETVNGVRYMVYPIKKELIFPQRSGKIKLEPFDMMVVVRTSFFESSRFDPVSNSPEIEVLPTPANAPASFQNAVGKFKLEASINKEEVNTNDGIDLSMKISGSGNLKLIHAPELNFPEEFEVYDPETTDKISVTAGGMSGNKEYKYLVIPRQSGTYTIDPVPFTYFDLETKNYVTLYTPKFNINVKRGKGEEQQVGTISEKTDVQIVNKEIRYLKKYESLSKGSVYFTGSPLYYTAIGAPVLCYLLLVFLVKRKKERYDPEQEREKNAGRKVVKQLHRAQQMLAQNQTADFYTELLRGIQAYYCERFNQQVVDFNRQKIREVMASKGVNETTVNRLMSLVDNCEMARYASFMQGNEQRTYEEANALVQQIEKEVNA